MVRGFLRAANEVRQSYQAQIEQRLQSSETDGSMPGDFPDVEIVRSGREELLLFPSYARRHIKRKPGPENSARHQPGTHESVESPHSSGDADFWKREWEKYEDVNAIVDVDVRGWVYSPQTGPMNRKNRLLVAVARRLSGIYTPTPSPHESRSSSQAPSNRDRLEDTPSRQEDEVAAHEADKIAQRGQREADAAVTGSYSQISASTPASRTGSPARARAFHGNEGEDDDPGHRSIVKRQSWNEPANMSRDELHTANELLMSRLKPFMSMPMALTPITVFFFNDQKSISKTVTTDESGHFNLRAALDFIPTQVRVLASENLSATEDVIITEGQGVSLISDIDDTIKHSAIASGAREIFKNTFIRDLGDLTIKGVKEWYTKMANLGVQMHYVSNSPWQLYPLLRSYFALAGLPPGSFHLKQYSGMLQGIFEPAAERKRGSLDRIMSDFPERKFILVGDSGEADLEVYTDVVLDHPGRVLGVFIRDVTTPVKKGFFDQAVSNTPPDSLISSADGHRFSRSPQQRGSDSLDERPSLPARPKSDPEAIPKAMEIENDLIDFSEDLDTSKSQHGNDKPSHADDLRQLGLNGKGPAPNKPNKPSSLRNFSSTTPQSVTPPTNHDRISPSDTESQDSQNRRKAPPPPKPRRASRDVGSSANTNNSRPLAPPPLSRAPFSSPLQNQASQDPQYQHQQQIPNLSRHQSSASVRSSRAPAPPPPISRTNTSASTASNSTYSSRTTNSESQEGYVSVARRQIASAYNALPAIRSTGGSGASDQTGISSSPDTRPAPPVPSRRGISSYPVAAAAAAGRWATGATGGDPAAGGDAGALPGAPYDKKLEIWRRRWQRAEDVMSQRGVVLRSWRVGSDVMDEAVNLAWSELERQG
jgi:phosphatidate phosphatase APP1